MWKFPINNTSLESSQEALLNLSMHIPKLHIKKIITTRQPIKSDHMHQLHA
jgi:hypothetical protein